MRRSPRDRATPIGLVATIGFATLLGGEGRLSAGETNGRAELIEVRKIWDRAPHNAFTDLVRFKGSWYCTFREAEDHWSPGADGKIRVIRSADTQKWRSVALFSREGDLRDPKLCVAPGDRLMLSYFRRFNPTRYPKKHEWNFVRFSENGTDWTAAKKVGYPDRWLWRITWHEGKAYGISHGGPKGKEPFSAPRSGRLLVSDDGVRFRPVTDIEYGGESTLRFTEDGTAYCLRRGKGNRGRIGRSSPPYEDWAWKPLDAKIGGPNMLRLPDGRYIAACRRYEGGVRTSLHWLNPEEGTLTECLELPSGGDTSYPGLVWHDGRLWVSYYSSHRDKTAIYLAEVAIR